MIAAVVTTHNEASTITRLIQRLGRHVDHIIVVDENSTDNTAYLAKYAGAEVLTMRGGIGPCLRFGFKQALTANLDCVVQIDAGGSHDPSQLPTLLASPADLVIGSRFISGASHGGPWWRVVGSQTYGYVWRQHTRTDIRDWTSGYRVFTADLLRELIAQPYRARMHAWNAEVLHHAVKLGAKIEEVPIYYYPSDSSLNWRGVVEAVRVLC